MALLNLGDDPWLLEYESCEKLHRDIMELLSQRQQQQRSSDKYSQLSANIRLRLKQFNNELNQLNQKLGTATRSYSITPEESERRTRQIELLHSKGVQMQKLFDDQVTSKMLEDRANLIGRPGASVWGDTNERLKPDLTARSTSEIRADSRTLQQEQERGLENLSQIISRQKTIAQTISTEVDLHNEILDDLGTHIDRTDQRVRTETTHIGIVDKKDKTCFYWVTIILLFICIIVVAVV